ncbi:MAG: hypothetical protein L0154_27440 [Chloroflexi bacterium]|nr:hypothetical protein [Chloroflexota bacterium]
MIPKNVFATFELVQPPLEGLFFWDTKYLTSGDGPVWNPDFKIPFIIFPSGLSCNLYGSLNSSDFAFVHLFEFVEIPIPASRDAAYRRILPTCEEYRYSIEKWFDDALIIEGYEPDEIFLLIFDNKNRRIKDIVQIEFSPPVED